MELKTKSSSSSEIKNYMQNKNNKIIICILVLVVITLLYVALKDNAKAPVGPIVENINEQVQDQIILSGSEYKNTELGFSFISPYGELIRPTYNSPEGEKEYPFISDGEKGKSFRGYISNNPIFFIAGLTPDYSAPRGGDCGEISNLDAYQYAVSRYGEISNTKGVRYVYGNVTTDDMTGPHQVAYFKLNKGPFPVLGFCGIGVSESDFKKIVDTVSID